MTKTKTLSIGSVRIFLGELEELQREISDDFVLFFRGHKDESFKLKPAIYRAPEWIRNEDVMFKELVLRCPGDLPDNDSTFQTLVKMQHYSLPTRLLDITTNPLIALYFASEAATHKPEGKRAKAVEGEVVVFVVPKSEIKYYDSDKVSVVANISRRPARFVLPPDGDAFNEQGEIKLLLHEIKKEKPYFEPAIQRDHLESVVCVKSKLDNPRIIRQDGAFFLFGIKGDKLNCAEIPECYLAAASRQRVIVKAGDKSKIRKQLEAFGITKATIYPEIEKVAEHIKSSFGPPSGSSARKVTS